MKRFADRLREARVAAGMTQEQLGFALGVTKSSVSAWENGREFPGFRLLSLLSESLGCSLDELVIGAAAGDRDVRRVDGESSLSARDSSERALLVRFRALPARRRAALLELISAEIGVGLAAGQQSSM